MFKKADSAPIYPRPDIHTIIQNNLTDVYFQAIIDFSNEDFFGYEGLTRSGPEMPNITPDMMFLQAKEECALQSFDQYCMHNALRAFNTLNLNGFAFINILPVNLCYLAEFATQLTGPLPLDGVVFELSERYPLEDFTRLCEDIARLRELGALIAIDDLGTGYSGLKAWSEIRPNFVKIDRHFISGIHNDCVKREFVRSIQEIARGMRCQVVAEGIEMIEEVDVLHSIGIKLGQGFFLHRPEPNPRQPLLPKLSKALPTLTVRKSNTKPAETAESILEKVAPLKPHHSAEYVNDLFKKNPHRRSIPIVDAGMPVGIISRTHLLEVFSGRYSHQLHGSKPITTFMNTSPIVVDCLANLQEISQLVTHNSTSDLNTDFIITRNGHYIGVGKVATLLEQITNSQIRYARYSNPLTLLPGNVPIYEWIDSLLEKQQDFWIAYFDINHFKPFNDYYGYSRGDEVIAELGEIIVRNTSPNVDMIGHVGGDDFVVIFRSLDWKTRCRKILLEFEQSIYKFYSEKEIQAQGIWCENRQGEPTFFKLLSLAIGAVNPDPRSINSHHEIAAMATDAKHKAKRQGGNFLFICRRRSLKNSKLHTDITESE